MKIGKMPSTTRIDENAFTILGTPESLNNLNENQQHEQQEAENEEVQENENNDIKINSINSIFDNNLMKTATTTTTSTTTNYLTIIDSPISDFYLNSTILITGGTGFLGKILIHKLLTGFNMKRIYVLIRTKDNLNVEERLQKLFNESIFDNIRKNKSQLFELVHPIRADYNSDEIFSNFDRKLLIENVEIVFNLVASVRFNEKLRDAIGINLLGTKKVLDLVEEIANLKSFVHISTLYCNCNRNFIGEEVYESNIDYRSVIKMNETLHNDVLEKIKHCILGELPNTYTMTKKLAEVAVKHRVGGKIPVGIFRPPIVMSVYKDPIPGWTDNVYGPSRICLWIARGVIRCAIGDPNEKANMVPADYCINALLASAWDISTRYNMRKCDSSEIPVYNYVFKSNNITWNQYISLAHSGFHEPFDKQMWCFSFILLRWKWLYKIADFFLHMIPGYIFDLIAIAKGRQSKFKKEHKKREKIIYTMSWFCLQHWNYSNDNIIELYNRMTVNDRKLLQLHWDTIDWPEYFQNYLSGIRKYYLKEKNDKLEKRRTIMKIYRILHSLIKSSCGISVFLILLKIFMKVGSKRFKRFQLLTI